MTALAYVTAEPYSGAASFSRCFLIEPRSGSEELRSVQVLILIEGLSAPQATLPLHGVPERPVLASAVRCFGSHPRRRRGGLFNIAPVTRSPPELWYL